MAKVTKNIEQANCITHSGTMHADEVFATAFLDMYLGERTVFRTNNVPDNINPNILVYDVGRGKYDHHQLDALKRENNITYSSFGLLWKDFGRDFLKKQDIEYVEDVFLGIDKDLVEYIDADDNGFFPKIDAKYMVKTLPGIIKIFNPSYLADEDESTQFEKAVSLAKTILEEEILYINGKVYADKQIQELLEDINENDKYIILNTYLPYEESVLNNEKANNILFVAFPSNRGGYAIKTLPKSIDDKTARLEFPEEWGGLEGKELQEVSGIKGLSFCHVGRFIISCKDLDTVYEVFDKIIK